MPWSRVEDVSAIESIFARLDPISHPKKIPTVLEGLGPARLDNYYWLRNLDDPDTLSYIEAENSYARQVLAELEPLRAKIYSEFLARIELADSSVPQQKERYWYYAKTLEDSQYEIHLRFENEGDDISLHKVILDENDLSDGLDYFALGSSALSQDERYLAYSIDCDGSELFTLFVKDLSNGETRKLSITNASYGLEFDQSGQTLFWVEADESMRPFKVWAYDLNAQDDPSSLLYVEEDESFGVSVSKSKDNLSLLIEVHSTTASEVHILDLEAQDAQLEVFSPRREGIEYSIEPVGDQIYILSNFEAENFRVSICPRKGASLALATDVVPYDPAVKIESIEVFTGYLAIEERRGGYQRIRLLNLATLEESMIPYEEQSCTLDLDSNPLLGPPTLRYSYTSMLKPRSIREYNFATGEVRVLKDAVVKGGFSPDNYQSAAISIAARDGVQVPVSLVWAKGTEPGHPNPLLLYGYGSYEQSLDPGFSTARLSLCDRGFVFAIAHVRGGGEMGRRWYLDGKFAKKRNTFNDFVDVAAGLCDLGWTAPGRIVSWGGSAGGMLVGAALNQRPDLFGGVVAEVPFVDCLTTISDPSLPLTIPEWEEWGNPLDDWEIYQEMASWSPYDNIRGDLRYPPIFATSGINDPRVSYFEPTKWVAKLRELTTDPRVLLWTESGAGHFGSSGRFKELETLSRVYAFIVACAAQDAEV